MLKHRIKEKKKIREIKNNRIFRRKKIFKTIAYSSMGKSVVDLMMFLDVCQLYLQTKRKSRNLCTLWAIVTFIRTEDTGEFLRWCRAYTVPYLRYRDNYVSSSAKEKQRVDKLILKVLQELFYCGCIPPSDIGL